MKKAFTLVDLLLTLCIIAVITVLITKVLFDNANDSVTLTKLKVIYNKLNDAADQTADLNAGYASFPVRDGSDASINDWFSHVLRPHLGVVKQCANRAGCWHARTLMRNGTKPPYDYGDRGIGGNNITFITNDNFMVNLDGYSSSDARSKLGINSNSDLVAIYVDINGAKLPNRVGQDIFVLGYTMERGILPAGADVNRREVETNCRTAGMYCLQKIIDDNWSLRNIK